MSLFTKLAVFRCAALASLDFKLSVSDICISASASTGLSELFNIVQIVVDLPPLHLEHFCSTFLFEEIKHV